MNNTSVRVQPRILIISCVFPPEPVVSAGLSYDLAKYLSLSAEVTVLSPRPSRPAGYEFRRTETGKENDFRHVITNSRTSPKSYFIGRLRESVSFGIACKMHINESGDYYDCIYMNSWPIFSEYLIARAAVKNKIKLITHIQDIYPESFVQKIPFLLRNPVYLVLYFFARYSLKSSSNVITISGGMKKFLCDTRKLPSDKIRVVFNWQDEKRYIKKEAVKENEASKKLTFMFLGTIGPLTNLNYIIDCFAKAGLKKAKLIIAGQGSNREKLEKAAGKYSDADISFITAEAKNVPKIQEKADILILSLNPGAGKLALPSKLISYMLSEKPILAAIDRDSDAAKIVYESGCGWIVSPSDALEVERMLNLICKTKSVKLKNMGAAARSYALKNFTKMNNLRILREIILGDGGNQCK